MGRRVSCKLFIPQLAAGRDHPTCCKYPARRRGRARGGSVGAGWGSLLSYYQDLDCALGAQGEPRGAQQGWETFGIGPRGAEAQPSDLSQVLEHDWSQHKTMQHIDVSTHATVSSDRSSMVGLIFSLGPHNSFNSHNLVELTQLNATHTTECSLRNFMQLR